MDFQEKMVLVFFLFLLAPWPSQLQASHCDKSQIYHDDFGYGYNINCQFLSNQNLDLLTNIKIVNEISLFIDRCRLLDLPKNVFGSLKNIRTISISNSTFALQNNSSAIFRNLSRLEKLEVRNTRFSISKETFQGLDNLKELILINNSLSLNKEQAIEVFSPLQNLRVLKVRYDTLKDISSVPICKMAHLKELDLEGNEIASLKLATFTCHSQSQSNSNVKLQIDSWHIPLPNQHFVNVSDITSNLIKLNLNRNKIDDLGYGLDGLVNLRQLHLQGNQLTELNSFAFHALHKIELIDLSYNFLSNVEENVFSGKLNLKQVDLSHNKIVKVDLHAAHLRVLNLAHNNCNNGCLIAQLSKLPMLESLNLASNNIATIKNLTSLSLKQLILSDNKLKLFNESLSNLQYLERLDLSNCHFHALPDLLFQSTLNLRFLDLSHNELTSLKDNFFANLHRLKYLNLSYNQIEIIQYESFKSLDSLQSLDLSDNKLLTVQYEQIFTRLPSLSKINIKNNLFSCDFLYEILHFLKDKDINFTIHDPVYDRENINGISCQESHNKISNSANAIIDDKGSLQKNETEIKSSLQVSESGGGMSAFSVVFILGIVLVSLGIVLYRLQIFYRKRRRRLDEFELIG